MSARDRLLAWTNNPLERRPKLKEVAALQADVSEVLAECSARETVLEANHRLTAERNNLQVLADSRKRGMNRLQGERDQAVAALEKAWAQVSSLENPESPTEVRRDRTEAALREIRAAVTGPLMDADQLLEDIDRDRGAGG